MASATVFVAHRSAISKEGEIVSADCPKLPIIGKDSKPKRLQKEQACKSSKDAEAKFGPN